MIPVAWMLAYWIRYKIGEYPDHLLERALHLLPLMVLIQGGTFVYFGLYRGIWRFASLPDLSRIVRAVVVSTAMAAVVIFFLTRLEYVPRSVFIIDAILLILLLGGTRLSYRLLKDHHLGKEAAERVLVVGAGSAGEGLVRDLLRMRPITQCQFRSDAPDSGIMRNVGSAFSYLAKITVTGQWQGKHQ
jgi:FlaA1/EpsC-like NDP-sugar epimerase